jgi:hypothetical protein
MEITLNSGEDAPAARSSSRKGGIAIEWHALASINSVRCVREFGVSLTNSVSFKSTPFSRKFTIGKIWS